MADLYDQIGIKKPATGTRGERPPLTPTWVDSRAATTGKEPRGTNREGERKENSVATDFEGETFCSQSLRKSDSKKTKVRILFQSGEIRYLRYPT